MQLTTIKLYKASELPPDIKTELAGQYWHLTQGAVLQDIKVIGNDLGVRIELRVTEGQIRAETTPVKTISDVCMAIAALYSINHYLYADIVKFWAEYKTANSDTQKQVLSAILNKYFTTYFGKRWKDARQNKAVIAALDEQGYLFYADGYNYLPA